MKTRVVTTARCLEGCGWTPTEDDVDRNARRHTGDKNLSSGGDGCFHATIVESVPA